jgi:hypothetical protein
MVRGQSPGGGKHVYAPRTRFITEADLEAFEIVSPKLNGADGAYPAAPPPRPVDLKSVMREMWK